MPEPMTVRTLRIPCVDEKQAGFFQGWLAGEGVDASVVAPCYVDIPTGGDPRFVWEIAEQAVALCVADDDVAARAARTFLEAPDA